jgi:hypothetical protein
MKLLVSLPFLFLAAACGTSSGPSPAPGSGLNFDQDAAGALPSGWQAGTTGKQGADASWGVRADQGALSKPNVLALTAINHSSQNAFNLCWSKAKPFRDGVVEVAVRADAGVVDQGGGPIWRVQDANNYYVCRFNPLETNYRVYVVKDGVRKQLATALAPDTKGWRRIKVQHTGNQITCWLDGNKLLEASDSAITAAGGVGLWTKADARTSFDDLVVAPSGG